MMKHNYRRIKRFKTYIIVLSLVLIILICLPALSLSRSTRQIVDDRFQDVNAYDKKIRHKNSDDFYPKENHWSFDFSHKRGTYPILSKNYRNRYNRLSPEEKSRLRKRYKQWELLPEEKQRMLRHRMKKYEKLPPQERERYRHRYRQFQQLSPDERYKIREKLRKWDSLPPEEREQIRQRFRRP